MNIVIAGGGTGGHIYPALAIAQQLKNIDKNIKISFIGTKQGLEYEILKNYDYDFYDIKVSGFERRLSFETIKSIKLAFVGLKQSYDLIKKLKPDIVLGTGGYVCGPVVLAAFLQGVKTCIQEQNAVAGVTNKILAKFAKRIYLGNKEAKDSLGNSSKILVTGNPIRDDIGKIDRKAAQDKLGLDYKKTTILVSGGSRGAMSINNAMLYVNQKLACRSDIQILHITGKATYDNIIKHLPSIVKDADNIRILPYMDNMPIALAATDLAISRAGAIALAEIAACSIASILVPYPYATANHQEHNAKSFEKENAAIVILDKDLTGEKLLATIISLLDDEDKLVKMSNAAKKIACPKAAKIIADDILANI